MSGFCRLGEQRFGLRLYAQRGAGDAFCAVQGQMHGLVAAPAFSGASEREKRCAGVVGGAFDKQARPGKVGCGLLDVLGIEKAQEGIGVGDGFVGVGV